MDLFWNDLVRKGEKESDGCRRARGLSKMAVRVTCQPFSLNTARTPRQWLRTGTIRPFLAQPVSHSNTSTPLVTVKYTKAPGSRK